MTRSPLLALALAGTLAWATLSQAAFYDEIIPQTTAARHGLTRTWYSQIQLDRTRARVAEVLLHGGTLFVQTDQAVLHALDAETGQTLWAVQVGRRGHPSMRPAANGDFVAVINGSYLYVVNRHNGKQLWETMVDTAPGAGPALSEQRAYVAGVTGMVLSYLLEPVKDPRVELGIIRAGQTEEEMAAMELDRRESLRLQQDYVPPLAAQSAGRAIVQPVITRENDGEEFVAWPTDRGFLFVGRIDRGEQDRFEIRYRLQTEAGISAQPTYLPESPDIVGDSGIIYAASRDGYVHAIRERSGTALWRFSTGEPLIEPAVAIGRRVFAATQPGGMYCLDAKTGDQLWWAPQLIQFIAASKDRVYVVDRLGRMVVLDVATGARLDALPFPTRSVRMLNDQTDRIYLVSETGLVQCLRETEQVDPIVHLYSQEGPPAPAQPPGPGQPAPPAGDNPFEGGQPAAPADDNPFEGGQPADDPFAPAADDNPFD